MLRALIFISMFVNFFYVWILLICMKISGIKFNNHCFKSCNRKYTTALNTEKKSVVYTTTYPFREIEELDVFVSHIINDFKDKNKVNIYSLACSDGTELYTTAILILKSLFDKKEEQKYFPLIGFDKDNEVINAAKSGRINLEKEQIISNQDYYYYNLFWSYFENKQEKLFIENDMNNNSDMYSFEPVRELRGKIFCMQQDMLNAIDMINDNSNTALICRNVFPYLSKTYQSSLYHKIKEKLHAGSMILTADFDNQTNFVNFLENGVKSSEKPLFQKISKHIYKRI